MLTGSLCLTGMLLRTPMWTITQCELINNTGESRWCSGHHLRLPPLRPGFDPGLVRGLTLLNLNLTLRVLLRGLQFFSVHKNQLSHQNLCHPVYRSQASGSGDRATTPNAVTLNKPFATILQDQMFKGLGLQFFSNFMALSTNLD